MMVGVAGHDVQLAPTTREVTVSVSCLEVCCLMCCFGEVSVVCFMSCAPLPHLSASVSSPTFATYYVIVVCA